VWVISFLIFLPLHRLSLKKVLKAKQDLVNSVDKVIYLLSKAQYSLTETQPLKYDPCFALMKTMFGSGHFEYIDNLNTIKENVKKVETLLKQRVISDEERNKIDSQKSSLKFHTFWKKFLGYELNTVTLCIYNLFW
jgi:superoxide dismutase